MSVIVALIIGFAIRAALLTLLLWVMIKLQKLDYFFVGVLVSAALACGLDMVPYVGHYVAVLVLYFCIWKVTRARLFPQAVLTVAVPCAAVFALNLIWLNAFIGDLQPGQVLHLQRAPHPATLAAKPSPPAQQSPRTSSAAAAAPMAHLTNSPAAIPAKAAAQTQTNSFEELLKNVLVEGATQNGDKSMLVIKANKKTYTLVMDEQTDVPLLTNGPCKMRLLSLEGDWATVSVNGQAAYLRVP